MYSLTPLTSILEIAIVLKVSYPQLDFSQKGLAGDPRRDHNCRPYVV